MVANEFLKAPTISKATLGLVIPIPTFPDDKIDIKGAVLFTKRSESTELVPNLTVAPVQEPATSS